MLSVDTETTGLDLYHGARPFMVTTCDDRGVVEFYEWDVDPLTREVKPHMGDLLELHERLAWDLNEMLPTRYFTQGLIRKTGLKGTTPTGVVLDKLDEVNPEKATELRRHFCDELVLQNSKFDVAMLRALFNDHSMKLEWNWERTHDTLIAGHILASNKPHDLTSMALQYLGEDIEPVEKALEACVKKARLYCQHRMPTWRIAKAGLEEMPSAGEKTWKYDAWLPRALALELGLLEPQPDCTHDWTDQTYTGTGHNIVTQGCSRCNGCRWYCVLREYANTDSQVTVALFTVMTKELQRRGLERYYHTRRKAMELGHRMEWRGVTGNTERAEEIDKRYEQESLDAGACCVRIAANLEYELNLPRSGNNHSLRNFCFGEDVWEEADAENDLPARVVGKREWLKLPVVRRTDGGSPSLDKTAMEEYLATLPEGSPQLEFVKSLAGKRSRDTARNYIQGYRNFWLPYKEGQAKGFPWFVLHPNLNPCGTDTLRWSSNHPNEQNISKKEGFNLRYIFGPPPGREWWSLDAKNIELRIPFWLAGEKELMDLFERPDDPPYYGSQHLLNFHTIYPDLWEQELAEVGYEKVGPHCKKKYAATWYQYCKNMGFAKQYGAQRAKVDATAKRVGAFDKIESRFTRLAVYNKKQMDFAEKHGYVETVPDRTVHPTKGYPLLCTRTDNGRILSTVPLSYHVQGTAMWWTFKAMIRVQAKLDEWRAKSGFDGHIAMQVHDEIVLDLPKKGDPSKWDRKNKHTPENKKIFLNTNLWRIEIIRELMAKGGDDIGVPTPVGCEYHAVSWDTGVTLA